MALCGCAVKNPPAGTIVSRSSCCVLALSSTGERLAIGDHVMSSRRPDAHGGISHAQERFRPLATTVALVRTTGIAAFPYAPVSE